MKQIRVFVSIAGMLFFLILLPMTAQAKVPEQINFQGYLTDGENPVPNGNYNMVFALYTVPVDGTFFWSESQEVNVENGIYNVILGQELNTLNPDSFDSDIYLGVNINSDGEMDPRQKLTSTAFALKSALADFAKDADTLDGQDSSEFDQSAHVLSTANPHNVTAAQVGAVTPEDLTAHAASASVHHEKTTSFGDLTDTASDSQIPAELVRDAELTAALLLKADAVHNHNTLYYSQAHVNDLATRINALESSVALLVSRFEGVTRSGDDITFSGVNVHIVSGSGSTADAVTGLGNLIVGYNENRSSGNVRTGSHNIVVGQQNNYSSYGGMVAGYYNTISGAYSSISGGRLNQATGDYSTVSAGYFNEASGNYSSVSAGYDNTASGSYSSASGGWANTASGHYSSVTGGRDNTASHYYSSVTGGRANTASNYQTSVTGGRNNIASGYSAFVGGGGGEFTSSGNHAFANYSAVLGGSGNIAGDIALSDHAIGPHSSVSGGLFNKASGHYSSVTGGRYNNASSDSSCVSGGLQNETKAIGSSISGGRTNTASGAYSSVSGGRDNTADGNQASVSGGQFNQASGDYSSVTGGGGANEASRNEAFGHYTTIIGGQSNLAGDPDKSNHTIGQLATVSGGFQNNASGLAASVSGGQLNIAMGAESSVSGGRFNQASGDYSSVTGGGGANEASRNEAFGHYTTILGGQSNIAGDPDKSDHTKGQLATVSGGFQNNASGLAASVSGGEDNRAFGSNSSVSGGASNLAWDEESSISGGYQNQTGGKASSISGGGGRFTTGNLNWRAGSLEEEY